MIVVRKKFTNNNTHLLSSFSYWLMIRKNHSNSLKNNIYFIKTQIRIISIILLIFIFSLAVFLFIISSIQPIFSENVNHNSTKILSKPKHEIDRTKIYYVFHSGSSYIDPVDPKGENCLIPWDYTRNISQAQLIVYNVLDNYGSISRPRDPNLRPDQATCLQSMESSSNYRFIHTHQKNFNYTMTYSLTSDVPIPYSEFFETNELPLNISEKKGNIVCAFISNCHASNGRKEYVEELMKYIKVDSYGSCLNNAKIPSSMNRKDKYRTKEAVLKSYKFTIAFENSNDPDYVSEKLFQPLRYGSVPIFRGCSNLDDFAPHHSTIDANKFGSPKELADYLLYLDANDTAYNEYLEWKYKNDTWPLPRIRFFRDRREYSVCALIERIHGLWINPFLTDWNRTTEAKMTCNKCLDEFDVEKRRIPILRKDKQAYDYPLGDYWSDVLNITDKFAVRKIRAVLANTENSSVLNANVNSWLVDRFISLFPPHV